MLDTLIESCVWIGNKEDEATDLVRHIGEEWSQRYLGFGSDAASTGFPTGGVPFNSTR